jgi:carbon monoxide dehydrogenase subunit G
MKLEQSFEVAAPLDRVWAALIDVEYVAPCLPGAAVTGRNEDGTYNGTFKVKIGPTSASYSGKLAMENVDEAAHTATMQAQGTDKRGQGGAKATILSSVSDAGNGSTRVEVVTDYHITGRLARFGRGGMIEEISNRLLTQFAQSLQASLTGDNTPAGAEAAAEEAAAESATTEVADPTDATEVAGAAGAAGATGAAGAAGAPSEPSGANGAGADGATAGQGAAESLSSEAAPPSVGSPAPGAPPATPSGPSGAAPPATPPVAPLPPRAPVPETEPLQGISFMASVLWSQVKKNPVPLAALAFGFLLALRLLRRRS